MRTLLTGRPVMTAAGIAVLMCVAGCSSTGSDARKPPSPSAPRVAIPSATPTTTAPTPPPPSEDDQAIARAKDVVRNYYKVLDQLAREPSADAGALTSVAASTGLIDARNRVASIRGPGYVQSGQTQIVSLDAKLLSLDFQPKAQPPALPTVAVTVCYDVSNVDVTDAQGTSIVTKDRVDRALERVQVANPTWPDPAGWRVYSSQFRGEACPA